VYLWVRDWSKGSMTPLSMPTPLSPTTPWVFGGSQFRLGGEQQIVAIRNGFVGSAPVLWPDVTSAGPPPTLTYSSGNDPYMLARLKLN
jgi:hypothetical protein